MVKNSMFKYLYDILTAEIVAGRVPFKGVLPSASRMSEQYNVGIRTVRDVLKKLCLDGYIHTEERHSPVVIYRDDEVQRDIRSVRQLLERKRSVNDVLEAMSILMPSVFLFCLDYCDEEDFRQCDRLIKKSEKSQDYKECWRMSSTILHHILSKSGNLMMDALYSSLEIYCQVRVIDGYPDPFKAMMDDNIKRFTRVYESMRVNDRNESGRRISHMYDTARETIGEYLGKLTESMPDGEEYKQVAYQWDAARGKTYLYAEIAMDITHRICRGLWHDGDFLPSAEDMALSYDVSLYTVRKALTILEERGIVRIINGRGTKISLQRAGEVMNVFTNSEQKQDAIMYLCSMQLAAIVVYPAAREAFGRLNREAVSKMEAGLSDGGYEALWTFFECVVDAQPNPVLKAILKELGHMTLWGLHLMLHPDKGQRSNGQLLSKCCQESLSCLKTGDQEGFALHLRDCYAYCLEQLRQFMLSAGLIEAKKIKLVGFE